MIPTDVKVDPNPNNWIAKARKSYSMCYDGCNDCHDLAVPYRACQDTTRLDIQGIACDASQMWNWANDKYPQECLEALGKLFKSDALADMKQSLKEQFAMVGLCVLLGSLAALLIYYIWPRHRKAASTHLPNRSPRVSRRTRPPSYSQGGMALTSPRSLIAAAYLTTGVHGFACYGRGTHDQYFSNANKTISGLIHGWVSDCQNESMQCGETCTWHHSPYFWSPAVIPACTTNWCNHERETASPKSYVLAASRLVEHCGFSLVNSRSHDVPLRIPNPKIERDMWVKISVDKFNVTEETDPAVRCLYEIFQ